MSQLLVGCVAMWHRELFAKFGNFDNASSEDNILSFRAHLIHSDCVISNKHLVFYRQHATSICNTIACNPQQARLKYSEFAIRNLAQMGIDAIHHYLTHKENSNYKELESLLNQIYHRQRAWLIFPYLKCVYSITTKLKSSLA